MRVSHKYLVKTSTNRVNIACNSWAVDCIIVYRKINGLSLNQLEQLSSKRQLRTATYDSIIRRKSKFDYAICCSRQPGHALVVSWYLPSGRDYHFKINTIQYYAVKCRLTPVSRSLLKLLITKTCVKFLFNR